MCYVCNCFGWTLDLFQRGITFCLSCCMSCVICFGLIITVTAGIAFGYNYSFAEFITQTRSDVTVYMRRGQFYDHPDIAPPLVRRMGDDDLFPTNTPSEYEEPVISNKDTEPLSKKWLKDEDAREYAVKLTKYKGNDEAEVNEPELKEREMIKPRYTLASQSPRQMSITPIVIPTTILRSGSSEIILRKFLPLNNKDGFVTKKPEFFIDGNYNYVTKPSELEFSERQVEPIQPDIKIRFDDIPERKLLPISNTAGNSDIEQDDFIEEGSENDIMYKPV